MDLDEAARAWNDDGFVILPGLLPADVLDPAVGVGLLAALLTLVPRLRRQGAPTSAPVGALMGATLLSCACLAGALAVTR